MYFKLSVIPSGWYYSFTQIARDTRDYLIPTSLYNQGTNTHTHTHTHTHPCFLVQNKTQIHFCSGTLAGLGPSYSSRSVGWSVHSI